MSQHDDRMVQEARERLAHWAAWLQNAPGIGGRCSIGGYEERLNGSVGLMIIPDDDIAERAERILCRIRGHWPRVFRALYHHHYGDCSNGEVASVLGVSEATARAWVRLGEMSFASYWDAGHGIDTRESLKKSA